MAARCAGGRTGRAARASLRRRARQPDAVQRGRRSGRITGAV